MSGKDVAIRPVVDEQFPDYLPLVLALGDRMDGLLQTGLLLHRSGLQDFYDLGESFVLSPL